jgi:hypothetical protein
MNPQISRIPQIAHRMFGVIWGSLLSVHDTTVILKRES